ncbi:MAG: hypothetical protein AAF628_32095 [Planctomycetota bacterium]
MKATIKAIAVALLLGPATAVGQASDRTKHDDGRHVVELEVTSQAWNESRPWMKLQPTTHGVSAVVIAGPRLLTSAQVVADATLIQAMKHGRATKYLATVEHLEPDLNLAVLRAEDPTFFDDLAPVGLAGPAALADELRSVRWRNRQLEVSSSRLIRAEVKEARFSRISHAFFTVRSDLVGGGWSEPVFAGDVLLGLSIAQDQEQLAQVLPASIIRTYLESLAAGDYRGAPGLFTSWQLNRDRALAAYLGQLGPPRGILIRAAPWSSTADGVLQPRDLLLRLDDHDIDAEGYYEHPHYGRLLFTNIAVEGRRVGETLRAEVLRQGQPLTLELELRPYSPSQQLIPSARVGQAPDFAIFGGLVFRVLDGNYYSIWGSDWVSQAPVELSALWSLEQNAQTADRRRIILLTEVLPDPFNVGYHDLTTQVVQRVNGRAVDSMAELSAAFEHPQDGYHVIDLVLGAEKQQVVLDAAQLPAASQRILAAYQIPLAQRIGE